MAIINLRKYYYLTYKKDTFIEVSDEVAEALLLMLRAENNYERKRFYHNAFSLSTVRTTSKMMLSVGRSHHQRTT